MKKVPMRKCVACQESKPKNELLRIVRTPDHEIMVDLSSKKSGRGAYICYNNECLKNAIKKNILERKLETKINNDVYVLIESEIIRYNDERKNP